LYASTRNCAKSVSWIGKFFCTAMSVLKKLGPNLLSLPVVPI
jgi:hypothetical protein